MIDNSNCTIHQLAVHYAGNKTNGESLVLSKETMDVSDPRLHDLLVRYFVGSLTDPAYHSFTFSDGDHALNPVYNLVKKVFDDPDSFVTVSSSIATHLYEVSVHPQIRPGDIFVTRINGIEFDGEPVDALGIYKAETRSSYLKVSASGKKLQLGYEDGINIEKMDKACLVFNSKADDGYRMLVVDKTAKAGGAQYWKELFLGVKPAGDEFNHTRQVMSMAKDFVTKRFPQEFDIDRADQIDLLNRSVAFFKTHDTYERKEFENEVLHHPEMIKSFRAFNDEYSMRNQIDITDNFSISNAAVKNQAKIFKSVLKLDKNFHIYIHGDRDLIEKGTDNSGRKYYKIFYENEG